MLPLAKSGGIRGILGYCFKINGLQAWPSGIRLGYVGFKIGILRFLSYENDFLKSKAQIMPRFSKSRFTQCGLRCFISFIYNKLSAEIFPPAFFDHFGLMDSGAITRPGRCAPMARLIGLPRADLRPCCFRAWWPNLRPRQIHQTI